MKKSILVILLLTFSVLNVVTYAHEYENNVQDQINVLGVGEIEVEPDMAVLNIGINAQEPSLLQAKNKADSKYRQVLAQLEKADIDKKYVKATRLSAQPMYEWISSKRVYKGERVSRSINVTVLDLDKLAELMQALVENGVSTIDGVSAGFKNKKSLQNKALAAAADDAKSKAKFLAERLGRNLGSAFKINEQNAQVARPYVQAFNAPRAIAQMESALPPPDEMFGLQKISATIDVSFNLL